MKFILYLLLILGPGVFSKADPGVLERVAERRIQNEWTLDDSYDINKYDVLAATPDCYFVGKEGVIITETITKTVLVVDCAKPIHRQEMKEDYLLADVNDPELVHQEGYLIIPLRLNKE